MQVLSFSLTKRNEEQDSPSKVPDHTECCIVRMSVMLLQPITFPDEAYADYAEVSESDSRELARGLGLETSPNKHPAATANNEYDTPTQSHQASGPLRLILVDSDSQVSVGFRLLSASNFLSPRACFPLCPLLLFMLMHGLLQKRNSNTQTQKRNTSLVNFSHPFPTFS